MRNLDHDLFYYRANIRCDHLLDLGADLHCLFRNYTKNYLFSPQMYGFHYRFCLYPYAFRFGIRIYFWRINVYF